MSAPLPKTQSYKVLQWLQETRCLGHLDQSSVRSAVADWKAGGSQQNWILDVCYVESIDQLSLLQGLPMLVTCVSEGLHRIALAGPTGTEVAATMIAQKTGIDVRFFSSRDEAYTWFRAGCP